MASRNLTDGYPSYKAMYCLSRCWRSGQYVSWKNRCPLTSLHGVITQEYTIYIFTDVKPQNCLHLCRLTLSFHPQSVCQHSLTSRPKSLTQEQVRRRAVSVVPHEGVRESLIAWRQVVHPAQFHAVLLTVTVVVGLAVEVVMLRPAGEPVCR
jgi:hypothetical protein